MPHSTPPLAALVARLTSATTPTAVAAAQSSLYDAVLPAHVRTCTALVQRAHGDVWPSGEDLAQDTLVDALPQLRRGGCPNVRGNGLLRWLNVVAQRRLHAVASRHTTGTVHDIADVLLGTAARNSGATVSLDNDARVEREALMHVYRRALAQMPEAQATTWITVVEQETPVMTAATALGVHRDTVRRRVAAARAHLAVQLQSFAR
jgi:DNA-directed RNA polymerase specialized sigma24 family protein